MKKLFSLFLAFVFVVALSSFAAAANETTNIRDVRLRYCNGTGKQVQTKSLLLQAKPGQESTICIDFINEGNGEASLGFNFVDGTMTAGEKQNKACAPEGSKDQFGQYVTGYSSHVVVPPRSTKRVLAKLIFPEGYAGASYGCTTYFLSNAKAEKMQQGENMFSIFARVGTFVDAFVDGEIIPKLVTVPVQGELYKDLGHNERVAIYKGELETNSRMTLPQYHMIANIYNTGNIGVSGDVRIQRSSRWGLVRKTSIIANQTFLPKQNMAIENTMPAYMRWLISGPTRVSVSMDYKPIYLGAFNPHTQDTTTYMLSDNNSTFFFPWTLLMILCVVLVINKKLKAKAKAKTSK